MKKQKEVMVEVMTKDLKATNGDQDKVDELKGDANKVVEPADEVQIAFDLMDKVGVDYILLEDPYRNDEGRRLWMNTFYTAISLKAWRDSLDEGTDPFPTRKCCIEILNRLCGSEHTDFDSAVAECAARARGAEMFSAEPLDPDNIKIGVLAALLACAKASIEAISSIETG